MAGALLNHEEAKWHGGVVEEIAAPLENVWKVASVFCGLKKWVPTMEICERVEGEEGKPGCLRYVAGNTYPRADGQETWAKERLVAFDSELHSFSYAMEDGNIGLKGYKANFQLSDGSSPGTTKVAWSFEMNPIEGISEAVAVTRQNEFLSIGIHDLENVVISEIQNS